MDLQKIADAAKETMEFMKLRTGFEPYSMRHLQMKVSRSQAEAAQWYERRVFRDGECVFYTTTIDGIHITAEVDIGEYTEDELRAIEEETA